MTFLTLLINPQTEKSQTLYIKEFASLTHLPGVSLSTSFLEQRFLHKKEKQNAFSPRVNSASYHGYVYAR